jgi:hypothetical protein
MARIDVIYFLLRLMSAGVHPHQYVASARWSNRQFARNMESHSTLIHFQKCYSTMQELFEHADRFSLYQFLPPDRPLVFLDIACAPGGFSQYLLDHYQSSRGYGITLPIALGGFPMAVEAYPSNRFKTCYFDLLEHPMSPEPRVGELVDIAIGDAQYFPRSQEALEEYKGKKAGTVTGGRLGLLLREFIFAFDSLREGGIYIFRFVVWEKVHSNILRLFFLCFDFFEKVQPFKSEYQHTADCTFYAVCTGFKRTKFEESGIGVELRVAYARVVLSPPFAAVHNGTINCYEVINIQSSQSNREAYRSGDFVMDKPDAHILENRYPFKDMAGHEFFQKTCAMFEYVYKMFLIGQSSYTDHYRQ